MTGVVGAILGPLAIPECRRSVGRGWIILVRSLAGLAGAIVVLSLLWWWWFSQQMRPPGSVYAPADLLRGGLAALGILSVAIALVLTPALIAGSLAGENERGSLGLLLTTRVNALEIVVGRLAGKLCQVGQILLAGLPFLVLIGGLVGVPASAMAAMMALPLGIAFGLGGVSLAFSVMSRRGRDALLSVYLLLLLLLIAPMLIAPLSPTASEWALGAVPFVWIFPMVLEEAPVPALLTALAWVGVGLVGLAVAAWRLRPNALRLASGAQAGRLGRRRWFVPPIGERRPMLWKELFIERAGSIGRAGRWIGAVLILLLTIGGAALAGLIGHATWVRPDPEAAESWRLAMRDAIGATGWWVSALIQLAVGLRAAVTIASERERGTWDSLLTSPLEGPEIVVGKLWGSLYALRWLFAAALWAWTLALACGAMTGGLYAYLAAETLICGAFLAAVGIRASLGFSTATRAMAVTIGVWLGVLGAVSAVALMIVLLAVGLIQLAWWRWAGAFASPQELYSLIPLTFGQAFAITQLALYTALAAVVVLDCRLRFDRIAGRLAGGALEVAVDRAFHGRPTGPVWIGPRSAGPPSLAEPSPDRPPGEAR